MVSNSNAKDTSLQVLDLMRENNALKQKVTELEEETQRLNKLLGINNHAANDQTASPKAATAPVKPQVNLVSTILGKDHPLHSRKPEPVPEPITKENAAKVTPPLPKEPTVKTAKKGLTFPNLPKFIKNKLSHG